MNKIILDEDIIKEIDESILLDINNKDININILKNTSLEININIEYNITISVNPNVILDLDIIEDTDGNLNYNYNLDNSSILNIQKYNQNTNLKEKNIINLNGNSSKINYVFKTISNSSENYEVIVNHKASKTESNIINHGVNIDNGNLVFTVSSYIPNGVKGCIANQINRIINLTTNKCIINPNLFIDEEDVIANHAALIGKFSDEEMFYIQSRGIDYKNALNLLIKGFLISNIESDKIKDILLDFIDENWR